MTERTQPTTRAMRPIMATRAHILLASTILALAQFSAVTAIAAEDKSPGCAPGERIDGTTIESARAKFEKAGYRRVSALKKGCDSFWHGTATQDGQPIHVVLTPTGHVIVEGN
jgi:hypothetical protein